VKTTPPSSARTWNAFHLPQLAAPYTNFDDIVTGLEQRPVETLQESFALAVTEARQVFSDSLIAALSDPKIRNNEDALLHWAGTYPYFVGVDWGAGGTAATVVVFGAIIDNVFKFLAGFRYFDSRIPDMVTGYNQEEEIVSYIPFIPLLKKIRMAKLAADIGPGYVRNRMLIAKFGPERIVNVHYANQSDLLKYSPNDLLVQAQRDNMLTNFVTAMTMRPSRFRLPCMEDLKQSHWYADLKAVKIESDRKGNAHYIHPDGETDDYFHAMFNCILASHLVYPRSDLFPSSAFRL
jgi:hypothetical protein